MARLTTGKRRRVRKQSTARATREAEGDNATVGLAKAKQRRISKKQSASISAEIDTLGKARGKDNLKKCPVLSAKEKWLDAYRRVDASNQWKPPSSPYKLIQEEHWCHHWRVLVICILLNQTNGKYVRQILSDLFHLCPDAEAATKVKTSDIEKVIRFLGLQKKRSKLIKKLSHAYLRDDWTHVTQLPGIGRYAADAYAILCAGKADQVTPRDHMLVYYWKFIMDRQDA